MFYNHQSPFINHQLKNYPLLCIVFSKNYPLLCVIFLENYPLLCIMHSRKSVKFLLNWSIKKDRKPLILSGVRRTGKITLVNEF